MAQNSGLLQACTIIEQVRISTKAMLLRLPKVFDFTPGQIVGLSTDGALAQRWYSIASGPNALTLDILYTLVEDGDLTPKLFGLKKGDTVYLSPPQGSFGQNFPLAQRQWWIANGTGVAPFASMFAAGNVQNRALIQGARTFEDAYYTQLFQAQADFFYQLCLSRPDAPCPTGVFNGRLLAWLKSYGPNHWQQGDAFLLCGSDAMVVEVREILIAQGVHHDWIASEIYF